MNIPGTPGMGMNDSWYQSGYGLQIPRNLPIKASKNKALQLDETGYYNIRGMSLEQYVKYQLLQNRQKYFLFHEVYRRDTWVRATIDYIVRRVTRDSDRLVDLEDPNNPEIEEVCDWLDSCFPDGDFEDIKGGVVQDLLEYHQAYVFIEQTFGGTPTHLRPMDSRICFPITDFSGAIMFHAQVYNGMATFFMPEEVLYFPGRNNGANPKGLPNIETLWESVTMEMQANRFNMALFENNLNIGAVFSMPGADDDTLEESRRYLIDNYSGSHNAYQPLLLAGDAKMVRDGAMRTKDINFELLIRVARHRVSAVFGIPESLLGIPDNTNRATGDTHERTAYANTIRPMLKRVNRHFTRQLIHRSLNHPTVHMVEPLSSLLPTKEEIDAVNAVAENGILFNDYLEMTGRPRVPFGDYWVMKIPGMGGLVRLDLTAMPGIGFKHFDPIGYQLEHQGQADRNEQMSAAGLQPAAGRTPYVAPAPEFQLITEPVTRRIIDVSRGFVEPLVTIERRMPMNPGARGSTTVYQTKTGKSRYGQKPKGPQAPAAGPQAPLVNPKDIPAPPGLSDDEKAQMAARHAQVDYLFRQAQEKEWTTEQFMNAMEKAGWDKALNQDFSDAWDARSRARLLTEQNPKNTYALLGADGHYFIMTQPLGKADPKLQSLGGSTPQGGEPRKDTAAMPAAASERKDTGNPSRGKDDASNDSPNRVDAGSGSIKKSNSELQDWAVLVRSYAGGT